jgi:hypothetical protein
VRRGIVQFCISAIDQKNSPAEPVDFFDYKGCKTPKLALIE